MANRQKTVYVCSDCGAETPNWAGKCPSCGAWNTLEEMKLDKKATGKYSISSGSANILLRSGLLIIPIALNRSAALVALVKELSDSSAGSFALFNKLSR